MELLFLLTRVIALGRILLFFIPMQLVVFSIRDVTFSGVLYTWLIKVSALFRISISINEQFCFA